MVRCGVSFWLFSCKPSKQPEVVATGRNVSEHDFGSRFVLGGDCMLQWIDTAIAFSLIMLLLSILITAAVQADRTILDFRGKNFAMHIEGAVGTDRSIVPTPDTDSSDLKHKHYCSESEFNDRSRDCASCRLQSDGDTRIFESCFADNRVVHARHAGRHSRPERKAQTHHDEDSFHR
jgi:hypothetical protein